MGNSQLEFSLTISLAKTSNTRRTPSFDSWVSIVDKMWSRPTWSELLRVTWDFDSPRITGPMTAHQSVAYVRHNINHISTRCKPLYPKSNRISSNKSMNMMPSSPIHRQQRHFVDCQGTHMTQMTKDFAMRHDENYVQWNAISIKSHQFVTNCPYQTIYSKHNICSYEFLLRFHDSLPVDCAIKSGPRGCGKLTHNSFLNWFYMIPLKSS